MVLRVGASLITVGKLMLPPRGRFFHPCVFAQAASRLFTNSIQEL